MAVISFKPGPSPMVSVYEEQSFLFGDVKEREL